MVNWPKQIQTQATRGAPPLHSLCFFLTQNKKKRIKNPATASSPIEPTGKKLSHDLLVRSDMSPKDLPDSFNGAKRKKNSCWLICCPLECQSDFDFFFFVLFIFFPHKAGMHPSKGRHGREMTHQKTLSQFSGLVPMIRPLRCCGNPLLFSHMHCDQPLPSQEEQPWIIYTKQEYVNG